MYSVTIAWSLQIAAFAHFQCLKRALITKVLISVAVNFGEAALDFLL
jgi:hypothetical protein